jgi:methylenetetrahydrofolate dehydrogenase (NADP+)/methenyltetrahydrofolate cyclohydrolase
VWVLQKNATVTIVHSRTKDAKSVVSRADIVVAAVGRAEMVRLLLEQRKNVSQHSTLLWGQLGMRARADNISLVMVQQVKGDWIKPGAIVIDVGINSVDDPSSKKGYAHTRI